MSTSQDSPTTYWYSDEGWVNWLYTVANTEDPPLVWSISYGSDESYISSSEFDAFETQAIKLGGLELGSFCDLG
jgi:hypothetical protein